MMVLRKPKRRSAPPPQQVRPHYASGGNVDRYASDANSPYMGGPVGIAPHNPDGKPYYQLENIAQDVRAGIRAPSRPADKSSDLRTVSESLRYALDIADKANRHHYAGGGSLMTLPFAGRPHLASGGAPPDQGAASWLSPATNSQAQQMLTAGVPASVVYAQTGWRPDQQGALEYEPQVPSDALMIADQAQRQHLALGGPLLLPHHAARPHFEDGGGAGGDGGGGEGGDGGEGSDGGYGGFGGAVGGFGGYSSSPTGTSYGGFSTSSPTGADTTGMSSYGGFANTPGSVGVTSTMGSMGGFGSANGETTGDTNGTNPGFGGNFSSASGIGGVPGGINAVSANQASDSIGSGFGTTGDTTPSFGGFNPNAFGTSPAASPSMGVMGGLASTDPSNSGFSTTTMSPGVSAALSASDQAAQNSPFGGFDPNAFAGAAPASDADQNVKNNPFGRFNPGAFSAAPAVDSAYGDVTGLSPNQKAFAAFGPTLGAGVDPSTAPGLGFNAAGFSPTDVGPGEWGMVNPNTDGTISAPVATALGIDNTYGGYTNTDPDAGTAFGDPKGGLTVHPAAFGYAPGNITGDDPVGAFANSQDVTNFANAANYASIAKAMGMPIGDVAAAGLVARNMTEAGIGLPGGVMGIDPGAINVGDAADGTNSVGINQMNMSRLSQMMGAIQAGMNGAGLDADAATNMQSAGYAQSPQEAADARDALRATPGVMTSEMAATLGQINNDPAFAGVKAALTNPNATPASTAAAMQSFEGSKDTASDVAKSLAFARNVAASIGAINASSPDVGPTSFTPAPPSQIATPSVPAKVASNPPAAPAPSPSTPATADPNARDPNNPGFTVDGTPLGGQPVSTDPAAPNSLPATPSLPGDDDTPASPTTTLSLPGWLSGTTIGGMINAGLSRPGSPGQVTGGIGGSNGPYQSPPPAYPPNLATVPTDATTTSDASPGVTTAMQAYLTALANNTSGYNGRIQPIHLPTRPPVATQAAPYNPLNDPAVLRALGLAR